MNDFRGRLLPEAAEPAGYAWLIDRHGLDLPLPPRLAAIARRHHPRSTPEWLLLPPPYRPRPTLAGHLAFAFRREGIDLAVLDTLFAVLPAEEVAAAARAQPTGAFSRRLWFLREWLTGERLDLPDAGAVRYVPAVDTRLQFALASGERSRRHKVLDNLPGTPAFCPMVRRTPALDAARALQLDARARDTAGRVHPDLMARAASFLLLNDTKSSFAIEGERPSNVRAARWSRAIAEAGRRAPDRAELERLQQIVIGDARFVRLGLRHEGGFVGLHDRTDGSPLPDHVSARPEDLPGLVDGIAGWCARAVEGRLDPVVAAAVAAFGFVYVHPFEDGNGRIHRFLIHNILARRGFTPAGVMAPVSATMLKHAADYDASLEAFARRLMPLVDYTLDADGRLTVHNDTALWYRYIDMTDQAEALFRFLDLTIDTELAGELAFLTRYDAAKRAIQAIVDMPDRRIDLFIRLCLQNDGRLPARRRARHFDRLSDEEVAAMERAVLSAQGGDSTVV